MKQRRKSFRFSLNSNRDGHMTAAVVVGAVIAIAGAANDLDWLFNAGLVVVAWEWLATPDVDYANKRTADSIEWMLVCLLWFPFSALVKHRSVFSHSLLVGLPVRMAYVTLLIGVPLNHFSDGMVWEAVSTHWQSLLLGCAISDTVHLFKDGYHPVNVIFGKD